MRQNAGAAMVAMALVSCGDGLGGFLVSDADEVEMGVGVDQQIRKEYKLAAANDPAAQWLGQFIGTLAQASAKFRNPADIGGYKVAVIVDDELVNAFAAPGGYTYLSTGLILQAGNCGEIAGVMGHELAHVTERHSVKSIEEAYGVQVVSEWFLGEGLGSDTAATIYAFLANTQFSQEHEAEADAVGLQISHDAGYNPYGLVDFFTKLLALEGGGGGVPQFLSSHPATADRIKDVGDAIERRYGDTVNPGTTQTYECVGTTMSLNQLQAHLRSGQLQIDPATGTEPAPQ